MQLLQNSELHQNLIKEKYYATCIQKELLEYVANTYEDFESMWFENTCEDFISNFAVEHNVSFAFDENLTVSIVGIYE